MTEIYLGLFIAALCLILDEVFVKMRMPTYFKNLVFLYSTNNVTNKVNYKLPPVNLLQDTIGRYIKNKYRLFEVSQKEVFYREFVWDYSVSKYTVCPIHGTIKLVNPQKVKITVCLNLSIPGVVFFLLLALGYRVHNTNALWIVLAFLLVIGLWYYILIKRRTDVLSRAVKEWLEEGDKKI